VKRVTARILQLALEHRDFAQRLARELRTRPEFREHVEGKRFRNPETGNQVLYDSLPEREQRRIYLEWWRTRRREQEGARSPEKLEERRREVERRSPWALPLWKYFDRVQEGAGKKYHAPGEIKTRTIEDLDWLGPPESEKVKIGEKDFDGSTIDFYRSTRPIHYVKKDDDGNIVRDPETGLATYLDEEEMRTLRLPTVDTTLYAYEDGEPVGFVADEWGATLVVVAEERQKRGIGRFLTKLWLKAFPFKSSGGFSDQGLSTFKRVYQNFVREALESGEYNRAVEEGWMTPQRFMEILDSAGLDPSGKQVRQPTVKKPPFTSSKMQELLDQMAEEAAAAWPYPAKPAQDETESRKRAEAAKRYQELSDKAKKLEEEEKGQRKKRQEEEARRREELANAYWKARQRGNEEEARRLWDEM
jgi:hypothetical protein